MRKESMFGMIAFTIMLLSVLGLPQGFAANNAPKPYHAYNYAPIQSVSNPSASCVELTSLYDALNNTGNYGLVTITSKSQFVRAQNTNPNSVYSASIGYLNSKSVCDGTWKSLGSITTDQAGNGFLVQNLSLKSNMYEVELRDSAGNLVYATGFMSL